MIVETLDALGRRMTDPALLDDLGSVGVGLVQKNISNGNWTPNAPLTQAVKQNNKPLRDKGQLLASIAYRVEPDKAVIGTIHPAAEILHNGGVIRPKSARYLTIPANAEARAFMRRFGATPRKCIEGMKSAGYSIWFVFGKGGKWVFAKKGAKGKLHLLFLLKTSVTIPARPFMELPPEYVEIIERRVARRIFG